MHAPADWAVLAGKDGARKALRAQTVSRMADVLQVTVISTSPNKKEEACSRLGAENFVVSGAWCSLQVH